MSKTEKRSRRSSKLFAPSLTECDHCGKRRWTVIIPVSIPGGPQDIDPHICGQCLAGAVKELDRSLQWLLRAQDTSVDMDDHGRPERS